MTSSEDLRARALGAGVALSYRDQLGIDRHASDATLAAILTAMHGGDAPPPEVVIVTPEDTPGIDGPWTILHEDGRREAGDGAVPPLPVGRYLVQAGGRDVWVLSAPASLPRPEMGWGVTLPLYGLRGPRGGLGDYRDLAAAVAGLAGTGAAFVGINPIHAGFPSDPGSFSPYSPSHRRRFAIHHVAAGEAAEAEPDGLIDYRAAIPARLAALRAAFDPADPALDAFLARGGEQLWRYAVYEALAEIHGPRWGGWPAALQDAAGPAVARFAEANAAAVRFHAWAQMQAEAQLDEVSRAAAAAGMRHGLYLDLAVGTHPHGAETWTDPDVFAAGVSLGAPPDAFAEGGQVWGVAPFDPQALVRTGFAAFAATLRTQLRFAGMIRIDHILGLERAFWAPQGLPGTYVRMPRDALLAVIRIEAHRAGAVVVGEDLGNVPDGLRDALERSGILGCRVVQFEAAMPAEGYPATVLASFGTHDLPTWAGWREGADIAAREALGFGDGPRAFAERAAEVARLDTRLPEAPGVDDMHAFLAATPARLVAVQAEDALGLRDQPNLPGTTEEYPNWRRRLPVAAGELGRDPGMRRAAEIMRAAGR